MSHKISLVSTTVLNRLGETAVLSLFLSDAHFVTILPGQELVRHTAIITKFLVEFNKPEAPSDTFFGLVESVELRAGSVIALRVGEGEDLVLDVYLNHPEAPQDRPTHSVAVRPIGEPEKKIDTSMAKIYAESDAIVKKLFKIVNDPTDRPFPGAALRALINGPGKGLGGDPTNPSQPAQPDKFDQLVSMLMGGLSSAADQVQAGTIPKPPAVTVKPTADDESASGVAQMYQNTVDLQSVSSLYENILRVQNMAKEGRTQPYSITDPVQVCLAIKENADLAYQVAIGGLSGYYITSAQTANSYSKDVNSADFQLEFTSDLFKPFGITSDALTEISGILQKYISAIASIKLDSTSTNQEITHFVRATMISKQNVSGDDKNPVWVYQPEVKLIYMHINTQAYFTATSSCLGHSETESFHYDMEYTVYEAIIDIDLVNKNIDMLNKVINSLTGQNMAEFAAKPGISAEADSDGNGGDNPPPTSL